MMANRHQDKSGWSMKRRSPLRGLLQARQIYVRSKSDVQFITVSPISQISLLIIFLIGFLWMAFASVNIVFKDQLLELKQQKLFEARLDYENRLSEIRASVERVNDRLLLDQKSYLQKVDEVKAKFNSLAAQQKIMENFFKEGWFPLKQNAAPGAPPKLQVEGALESTFSERYAADFQSRLESDKPFDEMNGSFADLHSQQLALLKEAQAYSQHKLDTTGVLLTKLGIRPPATMALARSDAAGMGEPFVSMAEETQRESEIAKSIETVHTTLEQEGKVRNAVADLPLVKPMAQITGISSPYGYRKDPLRLSLAFHGGIDFKSNYAEPVLATSNGKVLGPAPTDPTVTLLKSFMTTASQPGMVISSPLTFRWGRKSAAATWLAGWVARGEVRGLIYTMKRV